jgi:hypothetical protein
MQVLVALTPLLPLIKAQYPDTEMSIQSDNASCLASHDIIAYIHHFRRRRARDDWTLTHLSSTQCFLLMSKAEMMSGWSSKYMTSFQSPPSVILIQPWAANVYVDSYFMRTDVDAHS